MIVTKPMNDNIYLFDLHDDKWKCIFAFWKLASKKIDIHVTNVKLKVNILIPSISLWKYIF